jgi:hypothetical protein
MLGHVQIQLLSLLWVPLTRESSDLSCELKGSNYLLTPGRAMPVLCSSCRQVPRPLYDIKRSSSWPATVYSDTYENN